MEEYEIFIEQAEANEMSEKIYTDLMLSIIISCSCEVDVDVQRDNISKSLY